MPKSTTTALLATRSRFQSALHRWYGTRARPLPWRTAPSLYATVVSEFMLQQTQVKTVLPYFARWLDALPDFQALADAPEARVLQLWEGLGYYSRARNLHRLAKEIAPRRIPPQTAEEWRGLPGVGPYTAAAIASIAFGAPAACVDGNVVRILSRLTANDAEHRDSASAARAFVPLAEALLLRTAPGDHNQAMMELGATVCRRDNPLCGECPVRRFCAAARLGEPTRFPRFVPKRTERRAVVRVWCECGGRLLLHRARPNARRFADMHELPLAEQAGLDPARFSGAAPIATRRRAITRYRITETIFAASAPAGPRPRELTWVPLSLLETITLSGPHRRWIREILATRPS